VSAARLPRLRAIAVRPRIVDASSVAVASSGVDATLSVVIVET